MAKVTLQTIADRLGVSRATVSYAFSRPDQVSAELRRRVMEVADELGYAGPNPTARSLRLGRAGALGLLFSETLAYAFADPYAVGFFQGLATAAEDAGVGLLILPLPRGDQRTEPVRNAVVDAFCVVSLPDGHPALDEVLARKLPVVVVDEPYVPGHPFLGIDEPAAGALAARHVLELGHRRLGVAMVGLHDDGHIGWSDVSRQRAATFEAMRGRRDGYQAAAEEAGVDWARVPFYELSRNSREAGRQAGHALLAANPRPTAILTNTDVLALGVLDAAADLGLDVPGELSVVGFSDSAAQDAGLTTIRQAKQEIGAEAGRLLLGGAPARPGRVLFPHELIVRASTAPPPPEPP
ncbi:LacI family DNA-binding transcriptional regulator [Nonomuraea roseoviolacea]|uniref:DNA-binding LacI/PurR family transcriptional regulator n=1 Tax=Nonomuraea roseoviolacea subsp. carminata TaxID=160689 RepID=A0ABT1JUB9_9ACTN|nr:LacI family DNA-binding transcriptional regulator [Nonomuraea roseoviolacea]MCP2345344.1 DNA-binding LacI/PurR family transcriptional regulator [Nonomuraea roseoviolacea subsp. carminata]